jgi:hypothetical protein
LPTSAGGWRHKRRETPDAAAAAPPYGRHVADRAVVEARQTYLVEDYRPGLTVDGLKQLAARVREAMDQLEREGKSVRYLHFMIVPADESLLCVVEAAREELVREAYARAGLAIERLSIVLFEGNAPPIGAVQTERSSS